MRQILLPVDPPPRRQSQPNGRWRDAPLVPGFGSRPLPEVLADVLIWRSRTAAAEPDEEKFRGVPTFRSGIPVPAADLHAFARGALDERTLDLLLRACLALNWRNVRHDWPPRGRRFRSPRWACCSRWPTASSQAGRERPVPGEAEPALALNPDWAPGLPPDRQPPCTAKPRPGCARPAGMRCPRRRVSAGDGSRIAAALVPRCLHPRSVLSAIATRITPDSEELS